MKIIANEQKYDQNLKGIHTTSYNSTSKLII